MENQLAVESTKDGEGKEGEEIRLSHALRSSNLPFYETVWKVARGTCLGVVAFGRRFSWDYEVGSASGGGSGSGSGSDGGEGGGKKVKRKSVLLDIVADDGEEWVKVSTVSESRLLFEMAKKGWEGDGDSEGEEGGRTVLQNVDGEGSDDEDEIELIRLAADMKKAASLTRVRYRHPRIRFVIPKIEEAKDGDIDSLLNEIRSYGVTVQCGERVLDGVRLGAPDLDLSHLLPSPVRKFSSTLNVDCTILLAAISDLSHSKTIQPSPIHHRAINRQIELDKEHPLLPTEVWPAMGARELVCTNEAAGRMHEIADVIGTDTEKERKKLMMGDPPFENWDTASLIQRFQELSDYQVPTHWKLPIKVTKARPLIDSARQHGKLPPAADRVAEILSDINYSVFLYGWSAGVTTISSNRTAVKQIEATVERHRNGDEDLEGPSVWVCDTARSLVGKEKDRKS